MASLIYPTSLGSSLHLLDDQFDSGDILVQDFFTIENNAISQSELYDLWINHSLNLFVNNLDAWLGENLLPIQQTKDAYTPYLNRQKSEYFHELLSHSWNTKIEEIERLSVSLAMRAAVIKLYDSLDMERPEEVEAKCTQEKPAQSQYHKNSTKFKLHDRIR